MADGVFFPFDLNQPAPNGNTEEVEDDVFLFDLNEVPDEDTAVDTQHAHNRVSHHHKPRPKLSCDTRIQILMWLLNNQKEGRPSMVQFKMLPRSTIYQQEQSAAYGA